MTQLLRRRKLALPLAVVCLLAVISGCGASGGDGSATHTAAVFCDPLVSSTGEGLRMFAVDMKSGDVIWDRKYEHLSGPCPRGSSSALGPQMARLGLSSDFRQAVFTGVDKSGNREPGVTVVDVDSGKVVSTWSPAIDNSFSGGGSQPEVLVAAFDGSDDQLRVQMGDCSTYRVNLRTKEAQAIKQPRDCSTESDLRLTMAAKKCGEPDGTTNTTSCNEWIPPIPSTNRNVGEPVGNDARTIAAVITSTKDGKAPQIYELKRHGEPRLVGEVPVATEEEQALGLVPTLIYVGPVRS